jgi:glycine oxidase
MLIPVPAEQPSIQLQSLLVQSQQMYSAYCAHLYEETAIDPEYWTCGARFIQDSDEQWLPDAAQVRTPRLLKALSRALELLKVPVIEHASALGWIHKDRRLAGVRTSRGDIACRQVVLAAGAWSSELAELAIKPIKGQMLLLRGKPGQLDHIRISNHSYLIPRRDGNILLGSTVEDVGFDTQITAEAKATLLERGSKLWPELGTLPIEGQWAGLRPTLPHGEPVIGPCSQVSGLFFNAGHFRLGITLAPASAQRLVDLMATSPS